MFERLVRLEKRDIRRHDGKRNQRRSCIVCGLFFLNEREFGLMARALYQFLSGSRLGNAHCPRYLDFDDEGMRTVQSRTDLPVHRSFVSI